MSNVTIAAWASDNPKGCRMPEPMNPKMADVLQKLRKMHCAEDKASHECAGRLIVDRNGMTLQCPLCGDERSVFPPACPAGAAVDRRPRNVEE